MGRLLAGGNRGLKGGRRRSAVMTQSWPLGLKHKQHYTKAAPKRGENSGEKLGEGVLFQLFGLFYTCYHVRSSSIFFFLNHHNYLFCHLSPTFFYVNCVLKYVFCWRNNEAIGKPWDSINETRRRNSGWSRKKMQKENEFEKEMMKVNSER